MRKEYVTVRALQGHVTTELLNAVFVVPKFQTVYEFSTSKYFSPPQKDRQFRHHEIKVLSRVCRSDLVIGLKVRRTLGWSREFRRSSNREGQTPHSLYPTVIQSRNFLQQA